MSSPALDVQATTYHLRDVTPTMAILPLAALEQHGPHLPVATDWLVIEHIARRVAEARLRIESPRCQRWYIGPVVARDSESAEALLDAALAPLVDQPVVIDTLDDNGAANCLADSAGTSVHSHVARAVRYLQPIPASASRSRVPKLAKYR